MTKLRIIFLVTVVVAIRSYFSHGTNKETKFFIHFSANMYTDRTKNHLHFRFSVKISRTVKATYTCLYLNRYIQANITSTVYLQNETKLTRFKYYY